MDVTRIDPLVSQIQSRFGWKISGQWNNAALTAILQAGDQIASYIHSLNQRDGDAIVRRHFPAQFIHSDWLGSLWFLKGKSFVFPRRVVRLAPNFEIYQHPDWHVVHELGHVLDNAVRRLFPATFFGGGLADRMIRDTGGRPQRCGLRFVPVPIISSAAPSWNTGSRSNHTATPAWLKTLLRPLSGLCSVRTGFPPAVWIGCGHFSRV